MNVTETLSIPQFSKLIKPIALALIENNAFPSNVVVQNQDNRCILYKQLQLIEQVKSSSLYYIVNKDWKGTYARIILQGPVLRLSANSSGKTSFLSASNVKAIFEVVQS